MGTFGQPPPDFRAIALPPQAAVASTALVPYNNNRYGAEWNDESRSEVSVLQYWRILCRHKKAIFTAAFVGLVLGFLAGIPMKPTYQAHTSLEVLSFNEDFMNTKETNPVSNGTTADTSGRQPREAAAKSVFDRPCHAQVHTSQNRRR
jgi:hypothetical protein